MDVVLLEYNCITSEFRTTIKGEPLYKLTKNGDSSNPTWAPGRIQTWAQRYVVELCAALESNEIQIEFKGTKEDMADLVAETARMKAEKKISSNIKIVPAPSGLVTVHFDDLTRKFTALLEEISSHPAFKDDEQFIKNIETLLKDNKFKVAVIATMKAGKSTLLNAMLGQKFLPARTDATTATLTYIEDWDDIDMSEATSYDINGHKLESHAPATAEVMRDFNENAYRDSTYENDIKANEGGVFKTVLKMDVPFIQNMPFGRLVLIDSPGPNNAMDPNHRKVTYELINKKGKQEARDGAADVVLYILNVKTLHTMADGELLGTIADNIKTGGIAESDRFIFVMNYINDWKTEAHEDGPAETALERSREFLRKFGIENPIIIPVDALGALLCRIHANLTDSEKEDLEYHTRKVNRLDINSLAFRCDGISSAIIGKASVATDPIQTTLLRTGVPIVEAMIEKYHHKYWLPQKAQRVYNELNNRLLAVERIDDLEQSVLKQDMDIFQLNEQIGHLQKVIDRQALLPEIKEEFSKQKEVELKNIKNSKSFSEFRHAAMKAFEEKRKAWTGSDVNRVLEDARTLDRELGDLAAKSQIEVVESIERVKKNVSQSIRDSVSNKFKELLESTNIEDGLSALVQHQVQLSLNSKFDIVDIANSGKGQEILEIGTTTVKEVNMDKAWYKPWTWFQSEYIEKRSAIYGPVPIINVEKVVFDINDRINEAVSMMSETAQNVLNRVLDDYENWLRASAIPSLQKSFQDFLSRLENATRNRKKMNSRKDELCIYVNDIKRFRGVLREVVQLPSDVTGGGFR